MGLRLRDGDPGGARPPVRFTETAVAGAFVVEPEPHHDERGLFARTWDGHEFAARGLSSSLSQCSTSFNPRTGTLRGMHLQRHPHHETKLVRCTRGRVQDVVVDLREDSATYRAWVSVELSWTNRAAMYVPPGCGHGFLTLEPDTEVCYSISGPHVPQAAAGVRWDDPAFGIAWAAAPVVIGDRDASYPSWTRGGSS